MTLVKDMNWKNFKRSEYVGVDGDGGCLIQLFHKDKKWYALINSREVYELNDDDLEMYKDSMNRIHNTKDISSAMRFCLSKAAEHKDIAGFYMAAYSEFQKRLEKAKEIKEV